MGRLIIDGLSQNDVSFFLSLVTMHPDLIEGSGSGIGFKFENDKKEAAVDLVAFYDPESGDYCSPEFLDRVKRIIEKGEADG